MIIQGAGNIYPREIKESLCKLDGVTETAVVGVSDEIYGELPKAYLVLKLGLSKLDSDLTNKE